MDDSAIGISGSWQEWFMVLGYVLFLGFVMWRVLLTKPE